jgi:hypothetical protein
MPGTVKISASQGRYIKLGGKGGWESLCLEDGTLRLAYYEVPHAMGLNKDFKGIRDIYLAKGLKPNAASSHANQVLAFYDTTPDTLWITFADGCLCWCFAQPEVEFIGNDKTQYGATGSRLRRTLGVWHNTTLAGEPLRIAELNGAITATQGYRGTICDLKSEALNDLVRRINGEDIPALVEARQSRQQALLAMQGLIRRLNPFDFELYVDLIFTRDWQRVSALGKTQKTIDMELVQPSTGQRAFVQVKSTTTQAELNGYVEQLAERSDDFMFYAYHTSKQALWADDPRVRLLDAPALAEMGWRVGLYDWLLQKSS